MNTKKISPVVLIVLRNKEGKYLLTLRAEMDPEDKFNNIWQIPGGGLEWGEKIEEALKREAREELGVNITVKRFIKLYEEIRDTRWHGILLCYLCVMEDETQPITINHESSAYKWYTPQEIKDLPSFPETMDIIMEAEHLNGV